MFNNDQVNKQMQGQQAAHGSILQNQQNQINSMMGQFGMQGMGDQPQATDADADEVLRSMGLAPPKNKPEDANSILRELGLDPNKRDEDDANILQEIDGIAAKEHEPKQRAQALKVQVERLKEEMKQLMQQGKKPEALAKLRLSKSRQQELEEIYDRNPDVMYELEPDRKPTPKQEEEMKQSEIEAQAAAGGKPVQQPTRPPPATNEGILEVYEKYHSCEDMKAVSVMDKEVARCKELIGMLGENTELIDALEDRIEALNLQKGSITSDIQNGFVTPQGYLKLLQDYKAGEVERFKAAKLGGLDTENLGLILTRVEHCVAEIKEIEKGIAESGEPEQQPVQRQPAPAQPGQMIQGNPQMAEELGQKLQDYSDAAAYMMKVIGNKKQAMEHLSTAEQCKKFISMCSHNRQIDQNLVPAQLTPEILFGKSADQFAKEYDSIITDLTTKFQDCHSKAKKCIDTIPKLQDQAKQQQLKMAAKKFIDNGTQIKQQIAQITLLKGNQWAHPPKTAIQTVKSTVQGKEVESKVMTIQQIYQGFDAFKEEKDRSRGEPAWKKIIRESQQQINTINNQVPQSIQQAAKPQAPQPQPQEDEAIQSMMQLDDKPKPQAPAQPQIQKPVQKPPQQQLTDEQPVEQVVEKPKEQPAQAQVQMPAAEDIADPENANLLKSAAYCQQRQLQINQIIQESIKNGERVPPHIKDLNRTVAKTKMIIQQGCGSGQITPEEYVAMLKALQAKDKVLCQFFSKFKDQNKDYPAKFKIVMARFKIVNAELKEIEAQM